MDDMHASNKTQKTAMNHGTKTIAHPELSDNFRAEGHIDNLFTDRRKLPVSD